jgi:hypothetical protein
MSNQNFRVEPGLEVGVGGSILSTNNGNIGIGSTVPTSKLTLVGDILVSGATTSSIFVGDLVGNVIAITGLIDNISGVAATYTSVYATDLTNINGNITNLSGTNSNFSGVSTSQNLIVQDQFNVYSPTAIFHNNVSINGNLSIGGTSFAVSASELQVADKNIILGFSTIINASDDSSNHGGIAIASTEGTPLVNLAVTGINSFPPTYKQILWVKSNTMGAGTTDAFLLNYGVGIGSTLVPIGTVLSAGSVQINSQGNITATSSIVGSAVTINSTGVNVSGAVTATSFVKRGGTSSQFLKADGSVDSNSYLTSVSDEIPSGTLMLFQQTAAPTGWTKQTTHNNKALRVVSGTAGSGGSTAFTSVFASRTPAGSVSGSNSGGSVSNHTLTTSEIPSHQHRTTGGNNSTLSTPTASVSAQFSATLTAATVNAHTQAAGGGGAHNHGFTNPSWSGTFSGTALDFAVQYVDLIIASKN